MNSREIVKHIAHDYRWTVNDISEDIKFAFLLNNFVNNKSLAICGDINMILEDLNKSRIKKYSFKSKSNEDEPFNHLLTMKMNSSGNDVIFCL